MTLAELLQNQIMQRNPEMLALRNGAPDYGYGKRYGTVYPKQRGYFGEIKRSDGDFSTEISASFNNVGEAPLMSPSLTREELKTLLDYHANKPLAYTPNSAGTESTIDNVFAKSKQHALMRKMQGLDPFATINDKIQSLPMDRNLYSGLGLQSGAYYPTFSLIDLLNK